MTSLNVRANDGVRYIVVNVSVATWHAVLIVASSEFVYIFLQNGVVLNSTDTAVWLMNIKASRQPETRTLVGLSVAFKDNGCN